MYNYFSRKVILSLYPKSKDPNQRVSSKSWHLGYYSVRKPDFCPCENKGADQLCSNCTAHSAFVFRYMDSTISLLPKSEIASYLSSSLAVQASLFQTWSKTPKTSFLASRLILLWYTLDIPYIRKTCPCNVHPLKPHFYIAKLGYAGVYLFFLFLLQNIDCGYSLELSRRGGSNVYPQSIFGAKIRKKLKMFY